MTLYVNAKLLNERKPGAYMLIHSIATSKFSKHTVTIVQAKHDTENPVPSWRVFVTAIHSLFNLEGDSIVAFSCAVISPNGCRSECQLAEEEGGAADGGGEC